ncbi:MAG: PAS domain-containing hybrid sensor histidine kinase/response regulator [bacterium]
MREGRIGGSRISEDRQEAGARELQTILDAVPAVLIIVNRERRIRKVNRAAERFARRPDDEILEKRGGEGLRCLHHLDSPEGCGFGEHCQRCKLRLSVMRVFETGEGVFDEETIYPFMMDGAVEERTLHFSAVPLHLESSPHVLLAIEDITARREAERKLRESQRLLEMTFASIMDAIFIVDAETTKILNCNGAAEKAFGYPREEMIGKTTAFLHVDEASLREFRSYLYASVEEKGFLFLPEFRMRRRSGEVFLTEHVVTPIYDGGRRIAWVSVVRDITERKRLEQQLLQLEKLSSTGRFIAGIAHELNNPLTGVMGYAQLLLRREDIPEDIREDLEKINLEADRTRRIIRDILIFVREHKPEKRRVDIDSVIEDTLRLREYEMRVRDIKVVRKLDGNLPPTLADPNQLQQVFLNIISNAVDAMLGHKGEGILEIRTEARGDTIRATFSDTGPGIPEENLHRIFDPFFTTKDVGKGTGLGLSVSYGIIREHGGRIYAENREGGGAAFTVELPVSGSPSPEVVGDAETEPPDVAGKRVLVVDDEEVVVEFLSRFFEARGCRVDSATNGETALEKMRGGDFDLIVCDLRMPRMGGRELYEWMRRDKPHLIDRLVFITGDTIDEDSRNFFREAGVPFIAKPFSMGQFMGVIRDRFSSK